MGSFQLSFLCQIFSSDVAVFGQTLARLQLLPYVFLLLKGSFRFR
jgi:hypothetical protein